MSGSIRGGGGNPPRPPSQTDGKGPVTPTDADSAPVRPDSKTAVDKAAADKQHVDSFEAGTRPLAPHVENKLQALAGKGAAGKVQFTNKDLEYLAQTFAAIVNQNPSASRRKRARLFAKAILKQRRLRKLFAGASESEVETMYDIIGEQLNESPVFAQLVDEVTEGARKFNQ